MGRKRLFQRDAITFFRLAFRLVRCEGNSGPTKGGRREGKTSEKMGGEKQLIEVHSDRNMNLNSPYNPTLKVTPNFCNNLTEKDSVELLLHLSIEYRMSRFSDPLLAHQLFVEQGPGETLFRRLSSQLTKSAFKRCLAKSVNRIFFVITLNFAFPC